MRLHRNNGSWTGTETLRHFYLSPSLIITQKPRSRHPWLRNGDNVIDLRQLPSKWIETFNHPDYENPDHCPECGARATATETYRDSKVATVHGPDTYTTTAYIVRSTFCTACDEELKVEERPA